MCLRESVDDVQGHAKTSVVLGEAEQLADEVLLGSADVARNAPQQVDGDCRINHQHNSRYASAVRRAVFCQVARSARATPSVANDALPDSRLGDAAGDVGGIVRIDEHRCTIGRLFGGGAATGDHRRALHHRLEHGQPVALALARVAEDLGAGVQPTEVACRHEADEPDVAARRDGHVAPTFGSRDHERQRFVEQRDRLGQTAQVLARFDSADEQQVALGQVIQRHHSGDLLGVGLRCLDPQAAPAEDGQP